MKIKGIISLLGLFSILNLMLTGCGDEEDASGQIGSIYGIITELGTAEPMKAVGVELYKGGNLLLKTVTFDDGHFEFIDLTPGQYKVNVVADGYDETSGNVIVEAGRQARIDLQIKKLKTYMVVRTTEATIIGTKVTLNGEYTYESGYTPSEVGFMYATHDNPKNGGELIKCRVDNNTKTFSATIENLEKGTYYFQAYATNKVGKAYGEVRSFKMAIVPVVTTLEPTNVLATTATLNGRIDAEGAPAYTERGFVYSKSYSMPTVDDPANATTKISVSGRNKEFSANISSLTENSYYHVRAYAVYENGIIYGDVITFKAEIPQYVIIGNLMIQKEDLASTTWSNADRLCKGSRVAGFSDWRLPTIEEWGVIYDARNDVPNLIENAYYWSSSYYGEWAGKSEYYVMRLNGTILAYPGDDHVFKARAIRTINYTGKDTKFSH